MILLGGICMFYDAGKVRLNAELYRMESQVSVFGSEERKALRRAEKAEEAFRKSKGYPPNTFWGKVKRLFGK